MFTSCSYLLQKLKRTVFGSKDKNSLSSSRHSTEHSSEGDKRLLLASFSFRRRDCFSICLAKTKSTACLPPFLVPLSGVLLGLYPEPHPPYLLQRFRAMTSASKQPWFQVPAVPLTSPIVT